MTTSKWSLLVERSTMKGTMFTPTGRVIETDDPHAAVMAEQAKDGRSYSVEPYASGGVMGVLKRAAARLSS